MTELLSGGWEQAALVCGGQGRMGLGTALGKSEVGVMTQHKSQGDLADAQPWAGGRGIKGRCDGRRKAGT